MRIEDTDLERSEERFTKDIFESMKWLSLDWDEEPIFQSKRLGYYVDRARDLVKSGNAYFCTCTEADVEAMREKAMAAGTRPQYDRRCRGTRVEPVGKPWVIRAEIPLEGGVEWDDLVRGQIRIENTEVDDFVLIRSNGAPTYNLSVVVDDVESRMTHVVRGEEHTTNTPKQIHLYRFFKYQEPTFGHLPVILAADKKKLSKRHGAVAVSQYRAEGYLPEAMLNFLARLGWSHGDQEVFTLAELIEHFGFDHVQKSGAVFNSEKFLWLCGEHMRKADPVRLSKIIVQDFSEAFPPACDRSLLETPVGARIVAAIQPKVKLVKEIVPQLVPLLTPGTLSPDLAGLKWNKDSSLKAPIQGAIGDLVKALDTKVAGKPSLFDAGVDHHGVDAVIKEVCTQRGIKVGDLAQTLRPFMTAGIVNAGMFDLLAAMPWGTVKPRLEAALLA